MTIDHGRIRLARIMDQDHLMQIIKALLQGDRVIKTQFHGQPVVTIMDLIQILDTTEAITLLMAQDPTTRIIQAPPIHTILDQIPDTIQELI